MNVTIGDLSGIDLKKAIRNARKQKGWSQYVLSKNAGVHERTIVSWEAGDTKPSNAHLEKLVVVMKPYLNHLTVQPTWEPPSILKTVTLEDLLHEVESRGFNITVTSKGE